MFTVTMILMSKLLIIDATLFEDGGLPLSGIKSLPAAEEKSMAGDENQLKQLLVAQAKKDLARRLSVDVDKIQLREIRQVTWPDTSLGCPKRKVVYDRLPHKGHLIRLVVNQRMYFYHSAQNRMPFLCETGSQMIPGSGQVEEFIPPPGID